MSEIASHPESVEQTVEEQIESIKSKLLNNDDARRIVLCGKGGTGKTWMAREISNRAINEGLCSGVIWVYLNRTNDADSILHGIACQLSLICSGDELEDEDNDADEEKKKPEDEVKEKEEEMEKLKQKITELLENKTYLLVLDGEDNKMKEQQIMQILDNLIGPNRKRLHKVLITKRGNNVSDRDGVEKVNPLNEGESLSLFSSLFYKRANKVLPSDSRLKAIIKKTGGVPAAIIVIAEALGYIARHNLKTWTLEKALQRASKVAENGVTDIFRCGYDMLPSDEMGNCCWYSRQLFKKHQSVHYNELIASWIMEGYIGSADCIKMAYKEGHFILMRLIDCGLLKIQEDNIVTMEEEALKVTDDRDRGIGGTANLGLADVFEEDKWNGLGRIALADGKIKTLCSPKGLEKISTLLIDGNQIPTDENESFFEHMTGLQVLAIFKPRFESVPSSLSKKKLQVLVLRDCEVLKDVSSIAEIKTLTVLEISGAGCLEKIKFNLFEKMPELRSLNLSGARITKLDSPSINHLAFRWFILRGCSDLKTLPSMKYFHNLEVIDVSGSTSLENSSDGSFQTLQKLQMIDFSQTRIITFPFVSNLQNLLRIFLRSCSCLTRLPRLPQYIQAIDLSGCLLLSESQANSLEYMKYLRVLKLSKTKIKLPPITNLMNLSQLSLRACSHLTETSILETFSNLEVLDLSGTDIKEFPYAILELNLLKQLTLPELQDIDWGKMKCLVEELMFDSWGIFKLDDIRAECSDPGTSLSVANSCFAICPVEGGVKKKIINFYGAKFVRAIYFLSRQFPQSKAAGQFMEIQGFHTFPVSFKGILKHAKYVSFSHTSSISSLSDLGADNVKDIKGCWLDGCIKMESILHEEEIDASFGENLEILWASNLPLLRSICRENMQFQLIQRLKCLYLDCCPMLISIFTSLHLPKNLEVLEVKFCDKLETLFKNNGSSECQMEKLHTLHLLELPEFKSIGGVFPSLKTLKIRQCPMLVNISSSPQLPENLEVLKIKCCNKLQSLFENNKSTECRLQKLRTVHLFELPELKSIGTVLPSLIDYKFEQCQKLPGS